MDNNLNRRDFLKVTSLGATGMGALSMQMSNAVTARANPVGTAVLKHGSPLRVKPVLVYSIYQRKEAASWRPWGGIHTEGDADAEAGKIAAELKNLASGADFAFEVLPVTKVTGAEQAAAAAGTDCDAVVRAE